MSVITNIPNDLEIQEVYCPSDKAIQEVIYA
jgi:hypothetical protein